MTTSRVVWTREIGTLLLVQQHLMRLDPPRRHVYHLPGVPLPSGELRRVEDRLGHPYDPHYLRYLLCADHWIAILGSYHLLGASHLLDGPAARRGTELLLDLDDAVLRSAGVAREDLLPIIVADEETDLFVLARPSAPNPGWVYWFTADDEIDRWPGFDECFLSILEYNRLDLQRLQGRLDG